MPRKPATAATLYSEYPLCRLGLYCNNIGIRNPATAPTAMLSSNLKTNDIGKLSKTGYLHKTSLTKGESEVENMAILTWQPNFVFVTLANIHVPKIQGQIFKRFMPKKLNPTVKKNAINDTPLRAAPESANTAVQDRPTNPAFKKVPPTVPSLK